MGDDILFNEVRLIVQISYSFCTYVVGHIIKYFITSYTVYVKDIK